jgi:transcriptional regulator with XRE-family HTH domain
VAEGSPTVRRRELGALLRELRKAQDLTVEQVAAYLECSASKISRIETGMRGATARDVRDLCDKYGVTEQAERDRLVSLAREGKQQGWWQSYDLPYGNDLYVGYEAEAVRIKNYDTSVIPGLLQSADYALALYDDPVPEPGKGDLNSELIGQRVEARMRRQEILNRPDGRPPEFWAILDESALRRVVGASHVMGTQLRRIVQAMRLPNVMVQVIPFGAGPHPGMDSNFNILEFDTAAPDVVYSEGVSGFLFLNSAEDVLRYQRIFERLSEKALTEDDSIEFLSQIARSYESPLKTAG